MKGGRQRIWDESQSAVQSERVWGGPEQGLDIIRLVLWVQWLSFRIPFPCWLTGSEQLGEKVA